MAVVQNVSIRQKNLVLAFVIVLAAVSSTLAFQGRNGIGGERGNANTE